MTVSPRSHGSAAQRVRRAFLWSEQCHPGHGFGPKRLRISPQQQRQPRKQVRSLCPDVCLGRIKGQQHQPGVLLAAIMPGGHEGRPRPADHHAVALPGQTPGDRRPKVMPPVGQGEEGRLLCLQGTGQVRAARRTDPDRPWSAAPSGRAVIGCGATPWSPPIPGITVMSDRSAFPNLPVIFASSGMGCRLWVCQGGRCRAGWGSTGGFGKRWRRWRAPCARVTTTLCFLTDLRTSGWWMAPGPGGVVG